MCVFSAGNEYLWPFYSSVISLYIHLSACKGSGGGGVGVVGVGVGRRSPASGVWRRRKSAFLPLDGTRSFLPNGGGGL